MRLDACEVTARLGGHWYSTYGVAPCPVCQAERRDDQHALTLRDGDNGQLLAHCKKSDCNYSLICAVLSFSGIAANAAQPDPDQADRRAAERRITDIRQANAAFLLWHSAKSIAGTPAEHYLRTARGISAALPDTLRFSPSVPHPTGYSLPAMIALVQGVAHFAVHRTYLRQDGQGKATIEPAKAMLGACKGGAVALASAQRGPLVVCEGIETGLSLASGLVASSATIWAALSTSGMKGLTLPRMPSHLIVATDGDVPGRDAGNALAQRAFALGWRVELLHAPSGTDWNDILKQRSNA